MTEASITQWIDGLKRGDEQAAQKVWEKYFDRLVNQARTRLGRMPKRIADEEDVALSAFDSFCRRAREGKFPKLDDSEDLWKVLFVVVERKAIRQLRHDRRQKRGGGNVRGESVFVQVNAGEPQNFAAYAADHEPTPQMVAEVGDQLQSLLDQLGDETLQTTAIMKMEAYSLEEIAARLGCSTRSIKRKLRMIRELWSNQLDEADEPSSCEG